MGSIPVSKDIDPTITCRVYSGKEEILDGYSISEYYTVYIIRALYECFLVLNLSSPGSFNFYEARIDKNKVFKFNPSGYFFEDSWHQSLNYQWPQIKHIEPSVVLNWVRSLNIGNVELAKTKMERAIYALLHSCILSARELGTVIWLAYSLEALYETPVGQAFTVLFERIDKILKIPISKKKAIKKQLREFYNQRHKFAHGNSPIVHPIEDYAFDSESDKYLFKIQIVNSFAFCIALSSIQECIVNSWEGFKFLENSEGIPIKKT